MCNNSLQGIFNISDMEILKSNTLYCDEKYKNIICPLHSPDSPIDTESWIQKNQVLILIIVGVLSATVIVIIVFIFRRKKKPEEDYFFQTDLVNFDEEINLEDEDSLLGLSD